MPVPASISDLSPIPADNSPTGGEAVFPNLDDYLRAQAAFIAQVRDLIAAGGTPLGSVSWWGGNRTSINEYYLPMDGQPLSRSALPALWAFVNSNAYPSVSESEWFANIYQRGRFSLGDGSTTFRMPDLNGKQSGTVGAVHLRGDGAFAAFIGQIQDSQNQAHGHVITVNGVGDHVHPLSDPGHAHLWGRNEQAGVTPGAGNLGSPGTGNFSGTSFATTGITMSGAGAHTHTATASDSGGAETRVKAVTGVWIMRVK